MIKKIVLAAALIAVVFHIGWYAVNCRVQNQKLSDQATVQAVFKKLLADEKIIVDKNWFTGTLVEANGVNLHRDVFEVAEVICSRK